LLLTSVILLGATLLVRYRAGAAGIERTHLPRAFRQTDVRSQVSMAKVLVVEFLLMNCPHCARVTLVIGKLHKELARRGFQPIGIAFDNDAGGGKVTDFVRPPRNYLSGRLHFIKSCG